MKAVFLTGLREMEVRDVAGPLIEKDDDVLLSVVIYSIVGGGVCSHFRLNV